MSVENYMAFTNTCWLLIALYWFINSMNTKPTIRTNSRALRWAYLLALAFSFVLIYSPFYHIGWLRMQVIPQSDVSGIAGCIICASGILFAIWARRVLGTNWSGDVTLKKGHELIRSGPYSIVRHPIYTGALIGLLGSALVTGELKGFLAVILCFLGFWHKLKMEENFMTDEFPDDYPKYRSEVKMLIPFIF